MFVVCFGTGRCGSTPIVEVVSRHREVGFVSNVDDKLSLLNLKGTWNNRLHRLSPPRDPKMRPFHDRRKLLELGRVRVAPAEAWKILDRQVAPIMSMPFRDLEAEDCTPWLRDRFRNFFERRMAAQRCDVFIQHLTGWPRAGFIRAAFPDARFVHVVRDGRAVANSWLQMGWWRGYQGPEAWHLGPLSPEAATVWEESGRSFVVLAGLGWKMLIEAFERARDAIPADQWLEVRYEDVVAEPRRHIESILDFVGLPWSDEFEREFAAYPFEGGRVQGFRRDLDQASLVQLENAIGPTLRAYGYDTSEAGLSATI
ncbi:MAG TPA: sulfotransferase [Candidatus Saccharimonadales bacterium]|nr:sulfotransferase [Candidatus Saccharimonadales bacterium]